jgi:hypothetical protein
VIRFRLKPDLYEGKILGFWIQFEGRKPKRVR